MYIEDRLFSENTEETLYSVLLDEDEYTLYSEFQKEFGLIGHVGKNLVGAAKNFLNKIRTKTNLRINGIKKWAKDRTRSKRLPFAKDTMSAAHSARKERGHVARMILEAQKSGNNKLAEELISKFREMPKNPAEPYLEKYNMFVEGLKK